MNKQRKVLITTTYNEMGIIIDTKAEELDLSAQPNLQSTCNNLATDTISRQGAIDAADRADYTGLAVEDVKKVTDEVVKELKQLPSVQPEIIHCKDCKYWREHKYVKETKRYIPFCGFHAIYTKADDFCSRAERREE